MLYTGPTFRPPYEADSLLLQVSLMDRDASNECVCVALSLF